MTKINRIVGCLAILAAAVLVTVLAYEKASTKNSTRNVDYTTFAKNAALVFDKEPPDNFELISDNKMLNLDFTGFYGGNKLDKRSNDSIDGKMKEPSRYQFYFVNKEKTILVQLNLIYEPAYTSTRIIAATKHFPSDVSYFDKSYPSITDIYTIGYLIAFNGGIAKVDFMLANDSAIEDKPLYLLREGVDKFMPFIEELLLSYSENKTMQ